MGTEHQQRCSTSHKGRTDCAGEIWMKGLCLTETGGENGGRERYWVLSLVCFSADLHLPGCSLDATDVCMKWAGTIWAGLSSVWSVNGSFQSPAETTWWPGPQTQSLRRLIQYYKHKRIKYLFHYLDSKKAQIFVVQIRWHFESTTAWHVIPLVLSNLLSMMSCLKFCLAQDQNFIFGGINQSFPNLITFHFSTWYRSHHSFLRFSFCYILWE